MPIYEYRCDKGHTFEVVQRMTDDPMSSCESCGAPARRVFHPVAVHFKGSGFYNTDYGKRKKGSSGDSEKPKTDSGSGSDAKAKPESSSSSSTSSTSSSSD